MCLDVYVLDTHWICLWLDYNIYIL
jgi:hypothetical protein